MPQWTTAATGARFGFIVHHTDAAREWADDRYYVSAGYNAEQVVAGFVPVQQQLFGTARNRVAP